MKRIKLLLPLGLVPLSLLASPTGASILRDVRVNPSYFNPTAGETKAIAVFVGERGRVDLALLDRDGVELRHFSPINADHENLNFLWDGRDDGGEIVPDEAYSIRLRFVGAGQTDVYDPGSGFRGEAIHLDKVGYSPRDGVVTYRIPWDARVRVVAGTISKNRTTGRVDGPTLKVIADGEIRVIGSVIEHWNGFDDSGTVRVSELRGFALGVTATSLPESAIVVYGGRGEGFPEYAARHRPSGALDASQQEMAPRLEIEPTASKLLESARRHRRGLVSLTARVAGEAAQSFLGKPTTLEAYLDGNLVTQRKGEKDSERLELPAMLLARPGRHLLAVNWERDDGLIVIRTMSIGDEKQALK